MVGILGHGVFASCTNTQKANHKCGWQFWSALSALGLSFRRHSFYDDLFSGLTKLESLKNAMTADHL